MSLNMPYAAAGPASNNNNVIELLDDDDVDENNAVIDLSASLDPKTAVTITIHDGEVQVLESSPEILIIDDDDPRKLPATADPQVLIVDDPRKPPATSDPQVLIVDDPRKPPAAPTISPVVPPAQPPPVLRVLEIFPDADVGYVRKKLREQNNNIEIVVAVLTENENYPRQKKLNLDGTPRGATNDNSHGNNNTIIREMKAQEPMHDYTSPNASFEKRFAYITEAINLLMYDFSFLKKASALHLFRQNSQRYTLTRNRIHDMIVGKNPKESAPPAAAAGSQAATKLEQTENEHYGLLRAVLIRGALPREAKDNIRRDYRLAKPRKKIGVPRPKITDPILRDEHFHFEKRFQQWLKTIQDRLRGQAANKLALENGSAVQCNICFDDVAVSECVPCKEKGHLFCRACIVQYVESQVFGSGNLGIDKENKKPNLEIKCCEGSGCNSGFRDEMLKKVLPQKTWEKYSEMQAKIQIEQAGLGENLAMCPKCGYQAMVPELQNVFACPVEGCRFVSCRKCNKASHIPLRCEEVVQQDRRDEGRLKIEEALSEAKMRTCPKCNKKFIKSDGCNKMTCACGMKMCYVCRKPLNKQNPYGHFCQTPHCDHKTCGKCRLYTNDEEDDAQAMREAGIAAKEAFEAKVRTDGSGVTADDLRLNVDEMMHDPSRPTEPKPKRRRLDRNGRNRRHDHPLLIPHPHNQHGHRRHPDQPMRRHVHLPGPGLDRQLDQLNNARNEYPRVQYRHDGQRFVRYR